MKLSEIEAEARKLRFMSDDHEELTQQLLDRAADPFIDMASPAMTLLVGQAEVLAGQIQAGWDQLTAERTGADVSFGEVLSDAKALLSIKAPPHVASMAAFARPSYQIKLGDLSTMDKTEMELWLLNQTNKDRLKDLLTNESDPTKVAQRWKNLGISSGESQLINPDGGVTVGAVQQVLIHRIPGTIGGLNGVSYGARDEANRAELLRLKKYYEDRQDSSLNAGDPYQQADPHPRDVINSIMSGLYARGEDGEFLKDAKGGYVPRTIPNDPSAKRQLLNFRTQPPGVQISVGDLDAAKYITGQVPGLNTTVVHDIDSKVKQAYDQRLEQQDLAGDRGIDKNRIAVVAWLDVEPAEFPGQWSNDQAKVMASGLINDLNGVNAVHDALGNQVERTTLTGHSYGSLASMEAAKTKVPVDSLMLIGDIGAPDNVNSVRDLHLNDGGTVYRGSYDGDTVAYAGHGIGWQRKSTADSDFGAATFGVDGNGPGLPTKTHDGEATQEDKEKGVYGYFDLHTESSINQAKIALGLTGELSEVK